MIKNEIETLRRLNYELVKELGLFKPRAGLSFAQRHTLFHIKNNICLSIQELAGTLHVEHSTMSRNIKKLINEGLIEVVTDTEDKRRKLISLSEKGNKSLNESTESIDQMLKEALKRMSQSEINQIIKGVKKYCEALTVYNLQ